ncbi:hypothetical protein BH11PSE5_BH11PSE5_10970 [soil metagenome]
MKRLAVIIVNYRTPDLAVACIQSLVAARSSFSGLRAVVVDGGSGDGSVQIIAEAIADHNLAEWVEMLPLDINGGFAYANNRALQLLGAQANPPELVALINPDARVTPNALETLAATLEDIPAAGAAGGLLIHEDGRPQGSAFWFPTLRGEFCRGARTGAIDRLLRQPPPSIQVSHACEVPWVTGAAVMFRTAALRTTGLFDEGFFLYFEETELMWRLRRAGWTIWHQPAARIVHAGGAATKIRDPETGLQLRKRMPRYWYESRRRYFVLVGGRAYAIAAGLAWLAGNAIWRARRLASRTQDAGTVRPARDLIRYGWWPGRGVVPSSAPDLEGPVSATPAWIRGAA